MTILGALSRGSTQPTGQRSISFQDVWGKGLDWSDVVRDPRVQQMAIGATLACVDIKASNIAAMPLHEYRDDGGTNVRVPKSELLTSPSDVFEPEEWIYACSASLSLWDQAIGMVRATGRNGWPTQVEWLDPVCVDCFMENGRPAFRIGGKVHASYRHGGDIVQIRRRPIPGRVDGGMSTATAIRDLIAVGVEGARAVVSAYMDGGLPLSTLQWDDDLTSTSADAISERYVQKRRRHPGRPLVLGRGWKFETHERQNVTTDIVEIRTRVNTEVAVAHSVPPELVGGDSGGSMTYKNLEGLTQFLEVRTLLPQYVPMERAFTRLLPRPRFCRFNADAVLRTSLLDRMRSHDIAIRSGMSSRDERRAIEDQTPIPDGTGNEFLWPPYTTSPEVRPHDSD